MPMSAVTETLCTHIIFGFAKINDTGRLSPVENTDVKAYNQLVSLKDKNPNLRVLISVQDGFDILFSANLTTKMRYFEIF